MKHIDRQHYIDELEAAGKPYHANYYSMYSGILDGIITDPCLMSIPVDDHLVHRGDGVFETLKCVSGNIYNMQAHLDRLDISAAALNFKLKYDYSEISDIVKETVQAGRHSDCIIRILISRGPGSFGVNPYDCPENILYVTSSKLSPPFMDMHPGGAKVITTSIPVKHDMFACIKNCNYLPNVLMKREAVDAGADFAVAFDENGFLTEGATENMGIITTDGHLLFPDSNAMLNGTTMLRVIDLATELVKSGELKGTGYAQINRDKMTSAPEIIIAGTTSNVTSVTSFDNRSVGSGQPGPIAVKLNALLIEDILNNHAVQTPITGL